jgi:hypothetical protein
LDQEDGAMKYLFAFITLFAVTSCTETPKTETKKEPAKPLEPITGRQAFQQMYVSARGWAPDAQPIQLKSIQLQDVKAPAGKAGAWQCTFVSPGRGRAKMYTWSAVESSGNLHQGVFGGNEESYAPSRQQQPFLAAAIKTDSDEAYQTAAKKSADFLKKYPDMPVNFILEWTPRFPNLTWRVLWGESVSTSPYSVFVDATNGQFLEKMH